MHCVHLPQRLDAAKSRIESLNPLVTVETIADGSISKAEDLESIIQNVDLVCVTDWDRDGLVSTPYIHFPLYYQISLCALTLVSSFFNTFRSRFV